MAGLIRGMDPRENVYEYAHAAGRHFRVRPSQAHGHGVKITVNALGERIQTATLRQKSVREDVGFALALRALMGTNPRKQPGMAKIDRVLTVSENARRGVIMDWGHAPIFHGRKTRAELGLKSTLDDMDWDNA